MSWKGLVKVTFPSHLQTLMALFPKSKVLKGQVSRSGRTEGPDQAWYPEGRVLKIFLLLYFRLNSVQDGYSIESQVGQLGGRKAEWLKYYNV